MMGAEGEDWCEVKPVEKEETKEARECVSV
jgi:hypothetical protein